MDCLHRVARPRRAGSRTMPPPFAIDAAGRLIPCSAHPGGPGPIVRNRTRLRVIQTGMSSWRMTISLTALSPKTRFRSRPCHAEAKASVCPRTPRLGEENPLTFSAPRWPSCLLRRGVRLHGVVAAAQQVANLLTACVVCPRPALAESCVHMSFRCQQRAMVARRYRRFLDATSRPALTLKTGHGAPMTDTAVSIARPGTGPLLDRQTITAPSFLPLGVLTGSGRGRLPSRQRDWSRHVPRSHQSRGPNSLHRRLPLNRRKDLCSRRVPRASMPSKPPCNDWGEDQRSRRHPGASMFTQPL